MSTLSGYRREVLPNGLRIIGVEDPTVHSVIFMALVHTGPRFEGPGETGLTHFLEHLLMQGSEKYPSSTRIMREVEDLGGVIDASTMPEYLTASVALHRKHWDRGLEILSDVLLHPLLDEEEIEQEKQIVAQEIAEHRDRAGRNISASELAFSLAFKDEPDESGHRGTLGLLGSFDRQKVLSHYRRFFGPRNMVLCVSGDMDFDEVVEAVGEQFADADGGEDPGQVRPPARPGTRRAIYRQTENMPVAEVVFGHPTWTIGDERFHSSRALSELLGGGMSSRLFTQVREGQRLVYQIQSSLQTYSDIGSLSTSLKADTDNLVPAVESTLRVMEELAEDGPAEDELERYKETARCGTEIMCDRPERVADWFGKQELLVESEHIMTPGEYLEQQEAITMERLGDTIEEVLQSDEARLAVVGPYEDEHEEKLKEAFPAEEVQLPAAGGS